MNSIPQRITRPDDRTIRITWSDGQQRDYRAVELRAACPCATCREKRSASDAAPANLLPVLSPAETQPARVAGMRPVGNYAYNIQFNDGHDTGIFTFEFLRNAGAAVHDALPESANRETRPE